MPTKMPWSCGDLKALVSDPESSIFCERKKVPIMLQPYQLQSVKTAVQEILDGSIDGYDQSLEGIVLYYDHFKIISHSGNVPAESSGVILEVVADFYIFRPQVGCTLRGVVNKISMSHVGVLLYQRFNVSCPRPRSQEHSSKWLGNHVVMHQEVTLKLKEKIYSGRLPYFRGKLISCGKVINDIKDETQNSTKKIKKKKETNIVEDEPSPSSISISDALSKKNRKRAVVGVGVDQEDHSKRRKLKEAKERSSEIQEDGYHESNIVCSTELKKKKKKKKKESIDEVDFIPQMNMDGSFFAQNHLPDHLPSPMANSTRFDLGKFRFSLDNIHEKKGKERSRVTGLSDTKETLHSNKTVSDPVVNPKEEGVNTDSAKKKKKTKKIEPCIDSNLVHNAPERSPEFTFIAEGKVSKKHKERKSRQNNDTEDYLHPPMGICSSSNKSNKKERKDKVLKATTDITEQACSYSKVENQSSIPNEMKKCIEYDIHSHSAESDLTSLAPKKLKAKSKEANVASGKELSFPTKSNNATQHEELKLKDKGKEKRAIKSDVSLTEEDKNILSSVLKRIDKRLSFVEQEEKVAISTSKKMQDDLAVVMKKKKTRDDLQAEKESKKRRKEKSVSDQHLPAKKSSERHFDGMEVDEMSDGLVPPGQRVKSPPTKKAGIPNDSKSYYSPDVTFFPGNSMAGLDFGIKRGSRATPIVFGDIQGNIPPPPESPLKHSFDHLDAKTPLTSKTLLRTQPAQDNSSNFSTSESDSDVSPPKIQSSLKSPIKLIPWSKSPQKPSKKPSAQSPDSNSNVISKKASRENIPSKKLSKGRIEKLTHESASDTDDSLPPKMLKDSSSSPPKIPPISYQVKNSSSKLSLPSSGSESDASPPKKMIPSKLPCDSDVSVRKATPTSPLLSKNINSDRKISSPESDSESGSDQVRNKFLQSMGILRSPLKAAQSSEPQPSDSDSDSSSTSKAYYTQQPIKPSRKEDSKGTARKESLSDLNDGQKIAARSLVTKKSPKKSGAPNTPFRTLSKINAPMEPVQTSTNIAAGSSDNDTDTERIHAALSRLKQIPFTGRSEVKVDSSNSGVNNLMSPEGKPANSCRAPVAQTGATDSDSGPDDRNTTVLLQRHREKLSKENEPKKLDKSKKNKSTKAASKPSKLVEKLLKESEPKKPDKSKKMKSTEAVSKPSKPMVDEMKPNIKQRGGRKSSEKDKGSDKTSEKSKELSDKRKKKGKLVSEESSKTGKKVSISLSEKSKETSEKSLQTSKKPSQQSFKEPSQVTNPNSNKKVRKLTAKSQSVTPKNEEEMQNVLEMLMKQAKLKLGLE